MTKVAVEDQKMLLFLNDFTEALLVDLADYADEEEVPIGYLLIAGFEADRKGYRYEEDLPDWQMTAGDLRKRLTEMRGELALRVKSPC